MAPSRGYVKMIKRTMLGKMQSLRSDVNFMFRNQIILKFGRRKVGFNFRGLGDAQVWFLQLLPRCVRNIFSMLPCAERKKLRES